MRKEFDELLCSKYPLIFKDRHGDMTKTAMVWGFECSDGWFTLIDNLCRQLMNDVTQCQYRLERQEHMATVTDRSEWNQWQLDNFSDEQLQLARTELAEAMAKVPVAVQVKEKFGGLRFYVHGGTDKHHALISFAEELSYKICEDCGAMQDTKTYTQGWNRTLCPTHALQHYGADALEPEVGPV
jgi:hypothetical protein